LKLRSIRSLHASDDIRVLRTYRYGRAARHSGRAPLGWENALTQLPGIISPAIIWGNCSTLPSTRQVIEDLGTRSGYGWRASGRTHGALAEELESVRDYLPFKVLGGRMNSYQSALRTMEGPIPNSVQPHVACSTAYPVRGRSSEPTSSMP
jgi:hypothetical protein